MGRRSALWCGMMIITGRSLIRPIAGWIMPHRYRPGSGGFLGKRVAHHRWIENPSGRSTKTDTWSCFLSTTTTATSRPEEETSIASYQEFKELVATIRKHDALYYSEQQPQLTDHEFDALVQREADLCRRHPDWLKDVEQETGLGKDATRYGGRVGSIENNNNDNIISSEEKGNRTDDRIEREHLAPMLSLDNANDHDQLLAWLERVRKALVKGNETSVTLLTEPKVDGLSLSCRYRAFIEDDDDDDVLTLEWASTRGNGKIGQDVTAAVLQAQLVPPRIPRSTIASSADDKQVVLEVRGEVVLPQTAFSEMEGQQQFNFSNARNAASGILLRKDALLSEEAIALRQKLKFYAYDMLQEGGTDAADESLRGQLASWGFNVPKPSTSTALAVNEEEAWTPDDVEELLDYHGQLERHREGKQPSAKEKYQWEDYEMDGAVHKIAQPSLRRLLGQSNRAPRWAIAHKFTPVVAVTEILDVVVQVGRTGALTPVAVLEPVFLAGVQIQRATLHNFPHLQQVLQSNTTLPKGTKVMVRRAGEVIPQVVQLAMDTESISKIDSDQLENDDEHLISLKEPSKCPACGSPVEVDDISEASSNTTSVGQVLRCGGSQWQCPPRASTNIAHAFSRNALNLKGLSQARIEQLLEEGVITRPSDVLDLVTNSSKREEMEELHGWGKKSVARLVDGASALAAKEISFARFLYSLGIRFLGENSARLVAQVYGSPDEFWKAVDHAAKAVVSNETDIDDPFEKLREENDLTKGIGPVLLTSLVAFSKQPDLVEAAKALSRGLKVKPEKTPEPRPDGSSPESTGPLAGMTVVFTGTLPGMTRGEAQALAMQMGATSTPSRLSKSTGLVVMGNRSGPTKVEQATKLDLRVMNTEEFEALCDDWEQEQDAE